MKIWANTIVQNEENFIWFALMSVVDHVDKVLIYDTGSTDKTVEIIKEIQKLKKDKIVFKEVGQVKAEDFPKMRQAMLDESDCDWILILDGDEVWWEESIENVVGLIKEKGEKIEQIVVPFYNALGDIYHYQPENAGQYQILGRKGHLTIKGISKNIPKLHISRPYGKEAYLDNEEKPIQERDAKGILFADAPFLHLTHLKRSKIDHGKHKYELGIPFPPNFTYPQVFYNGAPSMVKSPLSRRGLFFEIMGILKLPYIFLKREFHNG